MPIANKISDLNNTVIDIKSALTSKQVNVNKNMYYWSDFIRSIKGSAITQTEYTIPSGTTQKLQDLVTIKSQMYSAIVDCGVTSFSEQDFSSYANAIRQITTDIPSGVTQNLVIGGPANLSGETCQYTAVYNETVVTSNAVWSVISGNTYATINNNGLLTILSNANNSQIIIQATFNGISKTKDVIVTYDAGTSTQTETQTETTTDASGNTTTTVTTTTTITDASGNTATTETISQTTENEDGTSTVTETENTSNSDGSSTSNSVTVNYNASGDVTSSNESTNTTNSDGSYNASSTNYNASGDPVDTTNYTGDTEGNVDTQDVIYNESGTPVVTGYSIDTSNSTTNSKDITGDGVNTEFVPFDGSGEGFICHIRFRTVKTEQPNPPLVVDTEDTGSNYLFNILTAKSPYKPYRGFHIRWALSKKNYSSGNLVLGYTAANASSTTSRTLYGVDDIYDIDIIYDPLLKVYPSKFRCVSNQGAFSTVSANITFETNNMDFVLGYAINQQDEPYRYSNVTIYDFSVRRLV